MPFKSEDDDSLLEKFGAEKRDSNLWSNSGDVDLGLASQCIDCQCH